MNIIKAYLGSPVVVVQDLSDGTSVVTAAEIVSTGDLYDYTLNTASVPQAAENEPGATGSPQPVDITTADYSGPDRRLITRRAGVERRVA
jgi:hypothetical protein